MKKRACLSAAVSLVLLLNVAVAQVPDYVNFQGRVMTPSGAPMNNSPGNAADGQINLTFTIYNAETGGAPLWQMTTNDVMVSNGLFSVLLGRGLTTNVFAPTTTNITRWLGVQVQTNGGSFETLNPRKELISVPYAIAARNADMLDGHHWSEVLTNEVDPQVDVNEHYYVPRWDNAKGNGGALAKGSLYDNGRIGLGTANPQGPLHVVANDWNSYTALFENNMPGGGKVAFAHGLGYGANIDAGGSASNSTFALDVNRLGQSYLHVSGDGKVGVGTPAPIYPFQLAASTSGWAVHVQNTLPTGPQMYLAHSGGYGAYIDAGVNASASTYALYVSRLGAPYVYVRGDGNVGIGLSNPAYKLDVDGDAMVRGSLKTAYLGVGYDATIARDLAVGNWIHAPWLTVNYDAVIERDVRVYRDAYVERNLGVSYDVNAGRNAVVGQNLTVFGQALIDKQLIVTDTIAIEGAMSIAGGNCSISGASWGDGATLILCGGPPSNPDAPRDAITALLPARQGFQVKTHDGTNWNMHVDPTNGYVFARTGFNVPSDSKIKLSQRPLELGVPQIMALWTKRYDLAKWRIAEETGRVVTEGIAVTNDIGLIADNVAEVIPEAVSTLPGEGEKVLCLNYSKVVVVLVRAVQEQQGQIMKQQQQIEELRRMVEALAPKPGK